MTGKRWWRWWRWWRPRPPVVRVVPVDLRLVRDLRVLRGELDAMGHDLRTFDHQVRDARSGEGSGG